MRAPVAVGIALAIAIPLTGGIASATSTAKSVKACRAGNGTLSLLVKGKCAKGTSSITLGAQGPAGARGATGPQGAQGNQGNQGNQGMQGGQGPAGPFETQLAAGQTLTGAYAAEADGGFVGAAISFPFPTAVAPTTVFVPKTGTNPDPIHCAGTAAAPTAAAGYACVYEGYEVDVNTEYLDNVVTGSRSGFTRFGGLVEFSNSGSSILDDTGTWAVTGS